jgi:ATP-dependent Clp protease ATP-binding subunit ClpC
MFERFSEAARRALFFARYEASRAGSVSIETEHMLLGVLRADTETVRELLRGSGISLESLRRELETRPGRGEPTPTSVEIPFSAQSKRALQFTAEQADRLRHSDIGPEHMLLGLLREEKSVAETLLTGHGLRLDLLRKALEQRSSGGRDNQNKFVGVAAQIETARKLVTQAVGSAGDTRAVHEIVERIQRDLDTLKSLLSPSGGTP